MDNGVLQNIRKIAIIALFSDDTLLDCLVLKGGNAISLIYNLHQRASFDIDLSMEEDFENIEEIKNRIENRLVSTFKENGYRVFDISLENRPRTNRNDTPDFWGGYELTFKVTGEDLYKKYKDEIRSLRSAAIPLGKNEKVSFRIDISKYEYCVPKERRELDHYTIHVYTPEMIVIEKIRSICQQMKEYEKIIKGIKRSPRAKDFYDIYIVSEEFKVDLLTETNKDIILKVFDAKRVPLQLIGNITDYYDYHLSDYQSLKDTVTDLDDLKPFEFYFNYVVELCRPLKPLWDK